MKQLLAAILITIAWIPAQAQDLPALYDVIDVRSDDVLNVRAGAGTSHPIVGELAWNQRGVEVLRVNNTRRWGLVSSGGWTGWASMKFLRRQAGYDASLFPARLWGVGTEPFWAIQFDSGTMSYQSPDAPNVTDPVDWTGASSNVGSNAFGFSTLRTSGVVRRGQCSDGMSDRLLGYEIHAVRHDGATVGLLSGCCTMQAP